MQGLRKRLHEIIFEAETPMGRAFDIALLWAIVLSVLSVIFESVPELKQNFGIFFSVLEWVFTILFTIEYILRLYCVQRPLRYVFSFYGIVDLLSTLPGYLALVFTGAQSVLVIRILRLLRVFRLFKLGRYLGEASVIREALVASRVKITVFLVAVLSIVIIVGTFMYMIEGEENGFTSIPKAIYWAIVTLTTVGYGDVAPKTPLGQFIASCMMIVGYGIIAVPTGIVTAELTQAGERRRKMNPPISHTTEACPHCMAEGHPMGAIYCHSCSVKLN